MSVALSVLVASLLGSVHCAAMCGGFVCLYAGESRGAAHHVAYNGGRLVSYLVAGLVAGLIGSALDRAGILVGIGRLAAIVSGALLILWGASLALRALGVRVPGGDGPSIMQRALGPLLRRTRASTPTVRAGAIGLLSTLLPCGWLYAFVATAGGTGSVGGALLVMTTFWLGTLPAMLTVGVGLQRLTGPWRARLPLVTAAAVVVIGTLSMLGRLQPGVHANHSTAPGTPSAHASHH